MMNTKLVTGMTVMVLLLGLTSHSLIGSAFALDAKGLDNKTKTDTGSVKGASDAAKPNGTTKTTDNANTVNDKTKSDLSHAMTKQEMQKINREKQIQDESAKIVKDKAKVAALVKASQDKSKADSKYKSRGNTKDNSKPTK